MSARGQIVEIFGGSDNPDKNIVFVGNIPETLHVKLDRQRTDRTIAFAIDLPWSCPLVHSDTCTRPCPLTHGSD